MTYLQFKLRQLLQRMWFLPAAFSLLAVLTVVIAYILARYAPDELPFVLPSNAVQTILEILASSLLTVAVFALSTVVGAFSAASSATTPRAVPLIAGICAPRPRSRSLSARFCIRSSALSACRRGSTTILDGSSCSS
ncbi:DUF2254 family protein [Devosia aurantiaca]|uniref:DUF2254 domain-containing protein n=1 Tax=Devosia aurantiaca TaxID=2714858 RepID=A0A6M1SNH3_9HYPH|nr:DUF2254 family protein [Devosia aurantiaca]NGP18680.1 DUF2254 domain-containing protein [Devosia aurantiaca]